MSPHTPILRQPYPVVYILLLEVPFPFIKAILTFDETALKILIEVLSNHLLRFPNQYVYLLLMLLQPSIFPCMMFARNYIFLLVTDVQNTVASFLLTLCLYSHYGALLHFICILICILYYTAFHLGLFRQATLFWVYYFPTFVLTYKQKVFSLQIFLQEY